MKKTNLVKTILSALFLALAFVLPFLTGQIPSIGAMLCPLHIPVLLCGFVCGPSWGLAVGFMAPLLRSFILGMPPLFPTALCMAFELAAYGLFTGLLYKYLPKSKPFIYVALLSAMIIGRLVWGGAMFTLLGISGGAFTLAAFVAGAFTNAIPGIIIQIVLVHVLVMVLNNPKITK